jgi:hypothetical protein
MRQDPHPQLKKYILACDFYRAEQFVQARLIYFKRYFIAF